MAEYRSVTADAAVSDNIIKANISIPDLSFDVIAQLVPRMVPPERIEYETGTFKLTSDQHAAEIEFANAHTKAPCLVLVSARAPVSSIVRSSNYGLFAVDYKQLIGQGIPYQSPTGSTPYRFGSAITYYTTSSSSSVTQYLWGLTTDPTSEQETYSNQDFRHYASDTGIHLVENGVYFWRASFYYEWIALWAREEWTP